jgi:tRNA 2-selenouridine synthase
VSVRRISGEQALAELARFDAVIDARSQSEYALDRLPGALNWPSLDDAERARVGTLYVQVNPFEARKLGAALVARNIAAHIERECQGKPKSWQPLLYCWRGGQRSGALALVLGQIGFRVTVIEGGYKAFRQAMRADLPAQVARLRWRVVCGPTGSGKTRLLHALREAGAQVLDLEGLASHRASVLGVIPGQPQPSQKHFETCIWQTLRAFDAARPVYVEAESKKVGNLALPDALIDAMRASPCLRIELPQHERVALLLEDYPFFVSDTDFFCQRLDTLVTLRGRAVVEAWQALARAGQTDAVVLALLAQHYDPGYASSTRRNFMQFEQARPVPLANRSAAALAQAAQDILATDKP